MTDLPRRRFLASMAVVLVSGGISDRVLGRDKDAGGGKGGGKGGGGDKGGGKSGDGGKGGGNKGGNSAGDKAGGRGQGSGASGRGNNPGGGSAKGKSPPDQDVAKQAVQSGRASPLSDLLPGIERRYEARLVDMQIRDVRGRLVYEMKMLTEDGRVFNVVVDALTGRPANFF